MAVRFSGSLKISVLYTDRGDFKASITGARGEKYWSGRIGAPPSGFGAGIAYDSPEAYDQTAHAALSFGADEVPDIQDEADLGPSGWVITRSKPAKG